MKQFLLILICLMPLLTVAQSESIADDSVRRITISTEGVWAEWHQIDTVWMHHEYGKILQNFKLKMSCAHCEDILMHVEMLIDSTGQLTSHKMIRSDKCGAEFEKPLEDAFMKWFYSIRFPAIFRNTLFTTLLGTGLKC